MMKHLFYSFLLILLSFFSSCQKKESTNTLVVGTNASYPPYESIDAEGNFVGFDIDIAKAIAEKMEKKLIIQEFSFDALILALKQKKIDLILSGMSITPSRTKEIAMVPYQGTQITSLSLVFWGPAPSFDQLKEIGTIAVQVGTYQEAYLMGLQGVKTKSLEGNVDIIMDLSHHKSAAAIFEPHIANSMQARFPELSIVEIPLPKKDWVLGNGIGIRKDNTALIEEVTCIIEELKKEGVITSLENKWFQHVNH